jgi:hypothetical protein
LLYKPKFLKLAFTFFLIIFNNINYTKIKRF